jgi:CBS domain-containing protein
LGATRWLEQSPYRANVLANLERRRRFVAEGAHPSSPRADAALSFCVPATEWVAARGTHFARGARPHSKLGQLAIEPDGTRFAWRLDMSNESTEQRAKKQELIDALQTARDTVRVQAHLFSLDVKERWRELENKLLSAEAKLEQEGESIVETIASTVDGLVDATNDVLRGIEGALDTSAPVSTIMTKDPMTCSPNDSLARAAQIIWERDCGVVPVVDSEGKLAGMITDRDIGMATYLRGTAPAALEVGSTMAKVVYRVAPNDSIARVAAVMGRYQVRRLPVVESGRLLGIVSLADLARYVHGSNRDNLPACVTLAHALGKLSEARPSSGSRLAAE